MVWYAHIHAFIAVVADATGRQSKYLTADRTIERTESGVTVAEDGAEVLRQNGDMDIPGLGMKLSAISTGVCFRS